MIFTFIGSWLGAWCGHTPDSHAFVEDVIGAMGDLVPPMSQKALAIEMDISEQKLSRQLAGYEPLNALRLFGKTSLRFQQALATRIGRRFGVKVITDQEMGALVVQVERLIGITGRMAKATYTPRLERESA